MEGPQSCIMWWQQACCGAGDTQASAGSAAQSSASVSIIHAVLLPTLTV
jgi:hypothetical protein